MLAQQTRDIGREGGARFGLGTIYSILTNSVYVGKSIFNKRCSKTSPEKPASEHIVVDVPPIIAQDEFQNGLGDC